MAMKINREKFINELQNNLEKNLDECILIYNILNVHSIIGYKNKEKIINDLLKNLNISKEEANQIYNISMSIILKNIL